MLPELLHGLLDWPHGDGVAAGVEAGRSTHFSDAQGAAQSVEDFDLEIDLCEHSLQALVAGKVFEFAGQPQERLVILPLAAQMDALDLFQLLPQNL